VHRAHFQRYYLTCVRARCFRPALFKGHFKQLVPIILASSPSPHAFPPHKTFGNMSSPSGTTVISRRDRDADKLQSPADQGGALLKVVLNSPRESFDYYDALVRLMYSKAERRQLYEPMNDDTDIDKMLDILYLVSVTLTQFGSTPSLICETLSTLGVAGEDLEIREARSKRRFIHSQEDV
jgi:hypothetical protein